jgi:hypothetical protein
VIDSIKLDLKRRLESAGYLARAALTPFEEALARRRAALEDARRSARRDEERYRLRQSRTAAQISQLRALARSSATHASLRADVRGVVVLVRREARRGRNELRVTIRRQEGW